MADLDLDPMAVQCATSAQPLLHALVDPVQSAAALASILPKPGDAAKAFAGPLVPDLANAYHRLFADRPPSIFAGPTETNLLVAVATGVHFRGEHPYSLNFPPGYRACYRHFHPYRVWLSWVYLAPGAETGSRYEGLVWLEDHWAWFPRPDLVLRTLER